MTDMTAGQHHVGETRAMFSCTFSSVWLKSFSSITAWVYMQVLTRRQQKEQLFFPLKLKKGLKLKNVNKRNPAQYYFFTSSVAAPNYITDTHMILLMSICWQTFSVMKARLRRHSVINTLLIFQLVLIWECYSHRLLHCCKQTLICHLYSFMERLLSVSLLVFIFYSEMNPNRNLQAFFPGLWRQTTMLQLKSQKAK